MATTHEIAAEADRVLAQIKGNRDKARVRELQGEYRKLSRLYEQAARAAWAEAPLGPVAA